MSAISDEDTDENATRSRHLTFHLVHVGAAQLLELLHARTVLLFIKSVQMFELHDEMTGIFLTGVP